MKPCPQCQTKAKDRARYCPNCGHDLFSADDSKVKPKRKASLRREDEFVGTILAGRFLITETIAKGGMGVVYRARDQILDEIVALKVLKADLALDEEMITRFKREIKVARKIKHPNACGIYDFWGIDDLFFISMEFIEGEELSCLIDEDRLPPEQLLPIVRGIILALDAAHRNNIIHRDLKPSNIMIDQQFRPIIMDFGIARYVGKTDLTAREEILGTPNYMSPEQFKGGKIDQRSDIYSFGVILYELFTGQIPFSGETPIEIAMKHIQEPAMTPLVLNSNIPENIVKIIMKCLEKDQEKRYHKIYDILEFLEEEKPEPPPVQKNDRILIADDEDDIRTLLSIILQQNGYEAVLAKNGEEAVSMAIAQEPALICLDLMMPKMDGYQAAEFLHYNKQTANIPVIMITCKDDKEYKAYSKTIGIREYMTKPLDLDDFITKIKQFVPL
ncbi:protein kinase [candidate division CSSED10-310 bacterium]|uniref:Protein kinase n=1 Tax=candidate division CSSED10-310 bacterium TaxID=2855610 RepID=A0ABV6Z0K9_UNCC1